ncbi:MAG: alpha/beta hydrolase [Pseudomonadota bacterium]
MIAAGIEYAEAGQGDPILCLHGIGGGIESFRPQLDEVVSPADAGDPLGRALPSPDPSQNTSGPKMGRVISWNMPGYGASVADIWPPSFEDLSKALGRFIAELGLERVHLVGQSIGGMLALEHGLRRPDQVATLTLIGTTPAFGGRDESFKTAFLKARLAPLEAGQSMAEMAADAAPHLVGPGATPDVLQAVAAPMAAVPEATWRGILECLVTFNRRDDLSRVTQPCCLIAGAHDKNAPARTMEKMAAKLPDAEYHLIETAGHMIQQEAQCETNAILARFLARHPI